MKDNLTKSSTNLKSSLYNKANKDNTFIKGKNVLLRLVKSKKIKILLKKSRTREIPYLKALYKGHKLKFNSEKVAEAILKEFKKGITR